MTGSPREEDSSTGQRGPIVVGSSGISTLRAKYLDYCSARVTDSLLRLTPDEMYLLAQEAEGTEGRGEEEGTMSYGIIVSLATRHLLRRLALPDFATWAREYERDPTRFEQEILGLWNEGSTGGQSGEPV